MATMKTSGRKTGGSKGAKPKPNKIGLLTNSGRGAIYSGPKRSAPMYIQSENRLKATWQDRVLAREQSALKGRRRKS